MFLKDLFRNNEPLFISSVLLVTDNGEKKDRVLILFQNNLAILSQDSKNLPNAGLLMSNELYFENKINLANNDLEVVRADGKYDNSKYCFELIGAGTQQIRLAVICSSSYDWKMWIDLLTNILQTNRSTIKSQPSIKVRDGWEVNGDESKLLSFLIIL